MVFIQVEEEREKISRNNIKMKKRKLEKEMSS
jgi:hypothetical protein